jgi:hypothetical protein
MPLENGLRREKVVIYEVLDLLHIDGEWFKHLYARGGHGGEGEIL